MPSIYTASCMKHAAMWRELRRKVQEFDFTANWPDHAGLESSPDNAAMFWKRDYGDIIMCEFLIIYAEPEDNLRGALVEAGIALGLGRTVFVVGEHPQYGTWQYHPGVHRVKDLNDAIFWIKFLTEGRD